MKKVYLFMSAFMLCGMSFGQYATPKGGLSPFAKVAPEAKVERPVIKHGSSSSFDRGSVIWSEDFANGLASTNGTWTTGGLNGNIWKHSMSPSNGCFSTGIVAPAFTTAGNGYMLFDADSANCIDPNPNPPLYNSNDMEGELISPTIDLTGEMSVDVVFEQRFRYCCTASLELMLGVSNDGGSTWTEYEVDGGVAVNTSSANPDIVQVNVSAVAANQSNVKIRFRWGGGISHYYWVVDDINLVPSPPHEVALTDAGWKSFSYAGADQVSYTMVPDEQAQDFYFYGSISNQGASTETVTFKSEVLDGASSVFTADGFAGATAMTPGAVLDDSTGSSWNSGTSVGTTYDFNLYFDYADIGLDAITTNNTDAGAMTITDNVYARDMNLYTGSGLWNGSGNAYSMGPVYNLNTTDTIWFVDCALTGSTDEGAFIYAQIYQIDQGTGSFDLVYDGSGTLTGEVEVQTYMISTSPNITVVKVPVENGFEMIAGEEYIVCIGHYGGLNELVLMNGQFAPPQQTVFVLSGTDNTWYYMTSTPIIRANFSNEGLGIETEEINAELGQNVPNPFNATSRINYSLTSPSDVSFEITDVTGKVVKRFYEGSKGAGEYSITLNGDEFAQGVYYYTLIVGEKTITKKMIVNK